MKGNFEVHLPKTSYVIFKKTLQGNPSAVWIHVPKHSFKTENILCIKEIVK